MLQYKTIFINPLLYKTSSYDIIITSQALILGHHELMARLWASKIQNALKLFPFNFYYSSTLNFHIV